MRGGFVWSCRLIQRRASAGKKWETFRGSKRQAEARLVGLQRLADTQQLGVSPNMTLAEFIERWLADYASARSLKTQQRYRQLARTYVVPYLGSVRLDKLAPMHFVRLQAALRNAEQQDGKGKLSEQTVLHVHRLLHVALRCAVEWRLIAVNPLDSVRAPRPPRREMRCFDVAEAKAFLDACSEEDTKWQAHFAMLLNTGCRPGELNALRWEDLDPNTGQMRIQRHVQRIARKGFVVGDTKTGSSRRTLVLGADMVGLLRRHRREQAQERLRLGPMWENLDLVFPSETGGFLETSRVHRVFKRICERAGLPVIRVYDLRHTSASLLLANGVDLKTVSERLGHANPTLVLTTYGHTLPGAQAAASHALEALLREAE